MAHSCILTDNAAQFSRLNFPGSKYVHFLDETVELPDHRVLDIRKTHLSDFPARVDDSTSIHLQELSPAYLTETILSMYMNYEHIFILLASRELRSTYRLMEEAIAKKHGKAEIHLLDTLSISIGEGQVIQLAAELLEKNLKGGVIEERLREFIPHTYTLLYTPNLSYLSQAGFLDLGQSISGEMLGFLPIFTLEDGKLNPVEKLKNTRSLIDYMIEYIDEFEDISNISFIQPFPSGHSESKLIRQHVEEFFPDARYSEHTINPYLASLVGPQGTGIVITEAVNPY